MGQNHWYSIFLKKLGPSWQLPRRPNIFEAGGLPGQERCAGSTWAGDCHRRTRPANFPPLTTVYARPKVSGT